MRLWIWAAIGCVVAYISMVNILSRTGEIDGVSLQSATVLYIIISITVVFIVYKTEGISKEKLLPMSERLEKVEKICNKCMIDGGKMKCEHYRNPQAVITRCGNSKNPDGK